jgi:hypothetical protein
VRQRSTLAHELAHLLFGDYAPPKTSGWDERSREEIRADAFARHLLVPLAGIEAILADRITVAPAGHREDFTYTSAEGGVTHIESKRYAGLDRVSLPDLSVLVQRFEASPSLVAIQLNRAGLISGNRKSEWMALSTQTIASRFGWSDQYQAWQEESHTRRAPQRLLSRAIQGYVANTVSLQAVARLRGQPAELIAKEFHDAGISPGTVEPVTLPPEPTPDHRPDSDFSDLDALDELNDFDEVGDPDEVRERAPEGPLAKGGGRDA